MDLIEISTANHGELPISKNTAYKWHSLKKYPRLVYKVGGKLFFDAGEWETMANQAKEENARKSERARRVNL